MIKLSTYARLLVEIMTPTQAAKIFADNGVDNAQSLSKEELRKQWLSLVKKYHTDVSDVDPNILKNINAAYDVLRYMMTTDNMIMVRRQQNAAKAYKKHDRPVNI